MFFNRFCSLCLSNNHLKFLFDIDKDGISHYNKLIISISEMNFEEMRDTARLICTDCIITLNTVYNFRQKCLKNKTNLINYVTHQKKLSEAKKLLEQQVNNPPIIKTEVDQNVSNENNCSTNIATQNQNVESVFIKEECVSEEEEATKVRTKRADDQMQSEKSDIKKEKQEINEIKHNENVPNNPEENSNVILTEPEVQEGLNILRPPEPKTELTFFECEVCGRKCTTVSVLLAHTRTHRGQRRFKCTLCDKAFNQQCNLTGHMRTHSDERPHKCPVCQKTFKHKEILRAHSRIHSGEKRYECSVCKKRFVFSQHLKVHMRHHTGERPYECKVCKRTFIQQSYLSSHLKVHSDERPFRCDICQKSYSLKENLTMHLKIHSGDRPYGCDVCHKRFVYNANLKVHMKTHSDERPFECNICKKRFKHKCILVKHERTHNT